ncbi:hypothetical protein DPEC_G00305260 [Dallia pectoralis]|uniref:Uncharacterized protein n=1 Tax=Dallia pectoralis TaxID=75939 RepID=A0ACC2FDY1_DALPE|nr:hypothetical protein DPEC_G00305260 [Dallia pectoralis]
MAESQLKCLDEEHVNERIPESNPEFYYSEEQRAALEQLLRSGDGAFKMRLKEDNARDFLSASDIKWIRKTFEEYHHDSGSESGESDQAEEPPRVDSGVHSTYWPRMSDTEIPPLDIGWPGGTGVYKGVTRVSVYTHPPKGNGPHIKEVVRRLIQDSNKVVAVIMDELTDLHILQDILDAAQRRGVAVYIVLEACGMPHFLDMCTRLQITALHLRNLRVRTVKGSGLALSYGKLPGALCSKYMLVDGEKVMFGSYSFTWRASRTDRNMITVMTGQVVDFFDNDFREMYAVSENVDLYKEFHISKPPMPTPVKIVAEVPKALTVSTSRFQVSLGDSRGQADMKVPAHKYHNPKYSLVVGNSLGLTGSLQDLSTHKDDPVNGLKRNSLSKLLRAKYGSSVELDVVSTKSQGTAGEDKDEGKVALKKLQAGGKKRSSFRLFLKGRGSNHNSETIDEHVAVSSCVTTTSQNFTPACPKPSPTHPNPSFTHSTPTPTHPKPSPTHPNPSFTHSTPTPTHLNRSPTQLNSNPARTTPSPTHLNRSPTQLNSTPARTTPSPTHPNRSPTQLNSTPARTTPSPTHLSRSPTQLNSTPARTTPSPTHLSRSPTQLNSTPARTKPSHYHPNHSPTQPDQSSTRKVSETNSTDTEDSFEIIEKPSLLKLNRKHSNLSQRSISLMTLNTGKEFDKERKKTLKKNCIQS